MNTNKFFIIISLLLLTGCVGVRELYTRSSYNQKIEAESKAWNSAEAEWQKKCGLTSHKNIAPAHQALARRQCWEQIVKKHVLNSVISYPDFNQYLLNSKQISLDFQDGKISLEQANLMQEKAFHIYGTSVADTIQNNISVARQKDLSYREGAEQARQQAVHSGYENPQSSSCRYEGITLRCN